MLASATTIIWKRLPQIEESRQLLLAHPGLLKHLLDRLAELHDGAPYLVLVTFHRYVEADDLAVLAHGDRICPG